MKKIFTNWSTRILIVVLACFLSGVAQAQTTISLETSADTYMNSGSSKGNYNYGGSTTLQANPYYKSGTDDQYRGLLLKWDISGIPADATVSAASITFYVTDASTYAYSLYSMRRTWTEGANDGTSGSGASWNYYGAGTGSWGTAGAANTSSDRYSSNLWDATASNFGSTGSITIPLNAGGLSVIQGWISSSSSNYGLSMQNYSGTAGDAWIVASKENTSYAGPTLNIIYTSTTPTITTSGTLTAFNSAVGNPSSAQTYTVEGINLSSDINISAPNGFEISTDGTTYNSSLTLLQSDGSVANTTIYVRLTGSAIGSFGGNIVHTSTGAAEKDMSVSGTVAVYYTLTVNSTNGTVLLNPSGGSYASGTVVTVTATPNTDYLFSNWSGDLSGNVNPTTITMDGNKSITAAFVEGGTASLEASDDAYISGTNTTNNYGAQTYLRATLSESSPRGSLIKWNLGSIPSNAIITSASLTLYVSTAASQTYYLYSMRRNWTEGSGTGSATGDGATWLTYDGSNTWGTSGAANISSDRYDVNLWGASSSSFSSTGSKTIDLNSDGVAVIQGWINGTASNYGLTLQNYASSGTAYDLQISSSENASNSGPTLNITYSLSSDPTIITSGTLSAFSSRTGVASAAQSYTIRGSHLTNDISLNAPNGFEISTDNINFSSNLILAQTTGTVAVATIYVRLNSSAAGTFNGNIIHTSGGAGEKVVAVSGTATTPVSGWIAYNDAAYSSGQPNTNITQFSIYENTSGTLVDYGTNTSTYVNAAFSLSSPSKDGTDFQVTSSGAVGASGSDAYNTFDGIVSTAGVVNGMGSYTGWWIDLTLSGLDPAKTYTFAGTSIRNSQTYTTRNSTFILSGDDRAVNASSTGVTVIDDHTIAFNTGYNSAGHIVKWTGINPGTDGTIVIRSRASTTAEISGSISNSYGLSAFMLKEEAPAISISGSLNAFSSEIGKASAAQTYTVEGSNLTSDINISAPTGFEISSDGSIYNSSLVLAQSGGYVAATTIYVRLNSSTAGNFGGNITHESTGATTKNISVNGTASVFYTLTVDAGSNGIITLNPEGGNYASGTVVSIIATANSGYLFSSWSGDLSGSDNPATITMDGNKTITAIFVTGTTTTVNLEATEDTYISSYNDTYNYGSVDPFKVTVNNSGTNRGALIKWGNLSSIPPNAIITGVTVSLNVSKASSQVYNLYNLRRSWIEGTLTSGAASTTSANWNTYDGSNSWGTAGATSIVSDRYNTNLWGAGTTSFSSTGKKTISLNSEGIAVVQGWVNGSIANYGLTMQNYSSTSGSDDLQINSSENGTAANRPTLAISYGIITAPAITTTGLLNTFTSRIGEYSSAQSYTVTGANLTDNLVITASANFEISTTTSTGFGSSVTLSPIDGTILPTTIYVRFLCPATGTITGNISHSSAGATTVDKIISGKAAYTLTINVNNEEGSITLNPAGGIYVEGTIVTLTPVPNFGYEFASWNGENDGDLINNGNGTWSIVMNDNKSLDANFVVTTSNLAPYQPTLVQPSDGVSGISLSPTLNVVASDFNITDILDVSFYGRKAGLTADSKDFMFVILPDIQNESQNNPAMLNSQMNWIIANQSDSNIVFTTSVGDLINNSNDTQQYENADAAFDLLDAANVQYSVGPGNHDIAYGTTYYSNYFGISRFIGKSWYGGAYDDYNTYSLFSASNNDFILINLQYNPTTAILNWADDLLKTYSGRRAIVEQHDILDVDNSWENQTSFTALKDNPNLFLMLCGHMHGGTDGAAYRNESGDDGHTIHIVQADYQDVSNGNGYLRILRFSPADDMIYMTTYSPFVSASITTSPDRMNMTYDLTNGTTEAYALIGTVNDIVNGNNASISWPGLTDNTKYEWYTTVSDGTLTTTGSVWSFTTNTSVNNAPVVTDIPDQTIAEGTNFTTINLDNYVSDIDNADAEITWTFTGNTNLSVSIVDRVATISVPDANWNGSETITFRATDPGALYAENAAIFTVSAVNDAPVIADIPDQTVAEGANFTAINLDDFVSDIDNTDSELTWIYSGNSELIVTIIGHVAAISVPNADWNGSETITFRATDPGALYAENAAIFTVSAVNDAPVIADIPDQTIAEGASFTAINLDNYVSDIETADADLTWTYSGNTNLTVSIVDRVATISVPNADWNGSETITFRATDPGALYAENAVLFSVTTGNDTPVVGDIPDQIIPEGNIFTTINLDDYVSDTDNADAEITWTYSGNTNLTVSVVGHVATISAPNANWNGLETITFRATDPGALYAENAAIFTVSAVNDAPVIADIPDQTIAEGASFSTINLDNYVSDIDNTDAELTWTYSGNTNLTVSVVGHVATISAPDANWNGLETITFRATDPGALYAENAAIFTVTAVNDAPVIADIPDQTIAEGASFSTINLDNYVSDIDNTDAELTWTYSGNTNLTVSVVGHVATISAPNANWNGLETITFRATDPGALYAENAAIFTVSAVNDAPVVTDIPDQSVTKGTSFVTINLDDYVKDIETADANISWNYSGNTNLTVTIINRVATISAIDANWDGSETITFTAADNDATNSLSAYDNALFTVNVSSVTQEISLQNGWNLFSLNVIPSNTDLLAILQPLIDGGNLIKVQDESGNAIEFNPITNTWNNDIGGWRNTEGYKIKVNGTVTLNITGETIHDVLNINLKSGWNIISYPASGSYDAGSVLSSLMNSGNLVKVQDESGDAIELHPVTNTWINNIGNLEPGEGYKVRVSADCIITIDPSIYISKSTTKSKQVSIPSTSTKVFMDRFGTIHFNPVWTGNGLDHMNIYISETGNGISGFEAGDEIGIFDGKNCVGAGMITNTNEKIYTVNVSADDPTTPEVDGFKKGNVLRIKAWRSSNNSEVDLSSLEFYPGTSNVFEPMGTSVINVNTLALGMNSVLTGITGLGENFPDPVISQTTIPFTLAEGSVVDISIYNMLGIRVKTLVHSTVAEGNHSVIWDISDANTRIMPGIYFCKMIVGNKVFVNRMEVIVTVK